ncbi:MAG TPA: glycosyltransferase family 4 protein [Candidatus Dormibacteraeota bacterium]|nr:glycosyltransferase family 4 protein [Candidatus Dormibacteraeota bacterium]
MTRRVLMTTTAYPPSIGGVQGYLADLCARLTQFEPEVVSLWLETRRDWLLGTTLRLGRRDGTHETGVRQLGWSASTRLRMAPWVLGYYGAVTFTGPHIARQMAPYLEALVTPDHAVIHTHRIGREFLAQASLAVARKRNLPFVLSPYHHPRWKGILYEGWSRVYRAADALFALTHSEKIALQRLGVAGDRIHVVYGAGDDPIPADGSRFVRRAGINAPALVLFLGQLYEYKGVAQLFAAAENLHRRGFQFALALVGPETSFSRRFLASRARPWLHVTGAVDNQTKWDALAAATVLCVPSSQESFGRVYIEAMSVGKPVIGGRIPAVSEVIEDGRTGLLVDPSSAADTERALERLLTDPELRGRLAEAGRRDASQKFSWPRVAERVESAYESLLVSGNRRSLGLGT